MVQRLTSNAVFLYQRAKISPLIQKLDQGSLFLESRYFFVMVDVLLSLLEFDPIGDSTRVTGLFYGYGGGLYSSSKPYCLSLLIDVISGNREEPSNMKSP